MAESVTILRYGNDGTPFGALAYTAAYHEEDLDGADKLEVTSASAPRKKDRLVWKDAGGTWHEHMVDAVERAHSGGHLATKSTCSNSISELFGAQASGTVRKGTVSFILGKLVAGTRWKCGSCSSFDGAKYELETWHKSVRECIAELVDLCGGELVTAVEVGPKGVTKRTVRIVEERGGGTAYRQFRYGANMGSVKRTVSADEVYTACIGYGAKLDEDAKSDYAKRLTVTVESSASLARWGTPKASGAMGHTYMTYTDDACTSRSFLKTQCRRQLKVYSKPLVRYEFETVETDADSWKNVRVGARVHCVDDDMGVSMVERVSYVKRALSGRMACKIAIGERANPLVEKFKAEEKTTKKSTGNSTKAASRAPVTTGGSAGGSGGDGWVHQIDGVPAASGTVNFVTTGGSSSGPSSGSSSGSWTSGAGWGNSSVDDDGFGGSQGGKF